MIVSCRHRAANSTVRHGPLLHQHSGRHKHHLRGPLPHESDNSYWGKQSRTLLYGSCGDEGSCSVDRSYAQGLVFYVLGSGYPVCEPFIPDELKCGPAWRKVQGSRMGQDTSSLCAVIRASLYDSREGKDYCAHGNWYPVFTSSGTMSGFPLLLDQKLTSKSR